MRIGIDTHFISKATATGNRTYTSELVRALIGCASNHYYFLYDIRNHPFYSQFEENKNVKLRYGLFSNGLLRNIFSIPLLTSRDNLDILHLQFFHPLMIKTPTILSIHDLYYIKGTNLKISQKILGWLTLIGAKQASWITTFSEYSKNDIVKVCRVAPERISVVSHGIDQRFRPISDQASINRIKKTIGIFGEYILYVGRTEDSRKNLLLLLEVFNEIIQSDRYQDLQLVIAGRHGQGTKRLTDYIQRNHLERKVLLPGVVPDQDLPPLLSFAKIFVYVSSFEGFGLPVLEAMACGVPVITSNVTSLPEVAGDAAIMVNPTKHIELKDAIICLIEDQMFASNLRYRGIERAANFTWERAAKQTLDIYENAAQL